MAALGLVNTLRAKNRTVDNGSIRSAQYGWGTFKELRGIDPKTLTRLELRNHLEARDLSTTGNKAQLAERLQVSVLEEQAKAYADAEDAEFQLGADLEERGAVYVVGANGGGQLGLGDLAPRDRFVVVPETRGAGVCFVASGYDISFAVTEDHDVLSWGGKGTGATGHRLESEFYDDDTQAYLEPKPIRDLVGEEVNQVQIGASHCLAASKGGDLYVWGRGDSGQLGLGGYESKQTPQLLSSLPHGSEVSQVAVGENHSLALTRAGELYSWGHGDRGRLGVETSTRVGVPDAERGYFPTPMLLHTFANEVVRQVSCGPSFCLAVTPSNIWAWGTGEGFVLGLGDNAKRETPVPIDTLKGSIVLQVECGTWHCAALVLVPPCKDGGYLYTWGSGYHGQLALGTRQVQATPAVVAKFLSTQQYLRRVWCGSHHCAAVTIDGEMYSWGSNKTGCLGRTLPVPPEYQTSPRSRPRTIAQGETFTADPGHVGGFGVLVDGVGRGLVRAVACGKEFTLVATYPYEGAVIEVAAQIMEASAIEEEEIRLQEEEERRQKQAKTAQGRETLKAKAAAKKTQRQTQILTRLCSICEECPGFQANPIREGICARCHHSISFHTKTNPAEEGANFSAASALSKY